MKRIYKQVTLFVFGCLSLELRAADYFVSKSGNDLNPGTLEAPFLTISAAAKIAQPGDVITVKAGVYRESVNPLRGGLSEEQRIVYQAAPGERVVISGSERIQGWVRVTSKAWKVEIPNTFFGEFNPFADLIRGDWFEPGKNKRFHTASVFVNGTWLVEAQNQNEVLKGVNPLRKIIDNFWSGDSHPRWFATVENSKTTIWAQFPGLDPNVANTEISVRQTVFYPSQPNVNFITVRGFVLQHGASNWAPPTAEQKAVIGTNWSRGWIIENNEIAFGMCAGLSLGKHGDEFDNKSAGSAEGYIKTIERAKAAGWEKGKVGNHIVRNNKIHHFEQVGIVGSLGGAFSVIEGNEIHNVHVRKLFGGAEQAAIKLHGAVDTVIRDNHIHSNNRGIWLDWMSQGTQVLGNFMHHNSFNEDLMLEVNHGPTLVANNLFLSTRTILNLSSGVAFVHNLFNGAIKVEDEMSRETPVMKPHSTDIQKLARATMGDERWYNNIFFDSDLREYNRLNDYVPMLGNLYFRNSAPAKHEVSPLVGRFVPALKLETDAHGRWFLHFKFDKDWIQKRTYMMINKNVLGVAQFSKAPFENPDGQPVILDRDYRGRVRSAKTLTPGPFEVPSGSIRRIQVWPK